VCFYDVEKLTMSVGIPPRSFRRRLLLATAAAAVALATGVATSASAARPAGSEPVTLRLGYFPNVTHAPAIVGVDSGAFAAALGPDVTLEVLHFNAGGEAIEALLSGAIDATFIGPNPAINGYAQSDGEALRIVAGTTSGGASLVVAEGIDSPDDFDADTKLASPALGNTQDVALRAWLAESGFATDTAGGGDVEVVNVENAEALTLFREGDLDGAWVPEPWATRLILEGGGHVLVDERDLWPDGEFVTTHLIVATGFLEERPEVVSGLLNGLVDSIDTINADRTAAATATNDGIEAITQSRLADETITGAFENLTFTVDPIASSLQGSADDAIAVGLLEEVDLEGIYDLTLVDEILAERGLEPVSDA
jgi:NitT/TauT family transport system substrate-binding protein